MRKHLLCKINDCLRLIFFIIDYLFNIDCLSCTTIKVGGKLDEDIQASAQNKRCDCIVLFSVLQ